MRAISPIKLPARTLESVLTSARYPILSIPHFAASGLRFEKYCERVLRALEGKGSSMLKSDRKLEMIHHLTLLNY